MINPLDSATSATTGTDLSPFLQQLAKRADLNHDGKVTSSEFSQFLGGLLASLPSGSTPSAPGGSADTALPGLLSSLGLEANQKLSGTVPADMDSELPALQAALPGLTDPAGATLNIPGLGDVNVGLTPGADGGAGWWAQI